MKSIRYDDEIEPWGFRVGAWGESLEYRVCNCTIGVKNMGAVMNEKDFQHNMAGADTMKRLAGPDEAEFWTGYLRGLRRHYHGEKFGTAEEHRLWMLSVDQPADDSRRLRGIGYRAGIEGRSVPDLIKTRERFADEFPRKWREALKTIHLPREERDQQGSPMAQLSLQKAIELNGVQEWTLTPSQEKLLIAGTERLLKQHPPEWFRENHEYLQQSLKIAFKEI